MKAFSHHNLQIMIATIKDQYPSWSRITVQLLLKLSHAERNSFRHHRLTLWFPSWRLGRQCKGKTPLCAQLTTTLWKGELKPKYFIVAQLIAKDSYLHAIPRVHFQPLAKEEEKKTKQKLSSMREAHPYPLHPFCVTSPNQGNALLDRFKTSTQMHRKLKLQTGNCGFG